MSETLKKIEELYKYLEIQCTESKTYDKRIILEQVWVLKKLYPEEEQNLQLFSDINNLYSRLQRQVFS